MDGKSTLVNFRHFHIFTIPKQYFRKSFLRKRENLNFSFNPPNPSYCPDADSLNIGGNADEKLPLKNAGFSQIFMNTGSNWKGTFTPRWKKLLMRSRIWSRLCNGTLRKDGSHCKSRPSQYELHFPCKELDLFAWGRQSPKLIWYVSTKIFCFSFPEICR